MNRHLQSELIWFSLRDSNCRSCGLHETAQTICLLGDGPVPCDGMVVGEAPGYREDAIEIPFSGKSGKWMRRQLVQVGLDPRKLFITNVVACRPPQNRTPTKEEARICASLYLNKQLELVKPKAVLLLGNVEIGRASCRERV